MRATFSFFRSLFWIILILVGTLHLASAATLSGKVYNIYLDELDKAVITIDTTPQQTLVSRNGKYSLIVPNGKYTLDVIYEENGTIYTTQESLIITADGQYTLDLILLPEIDEDILVSNTTEQELGGFEAETSPLGLIITLVMVLFFLLYIILTKAHFLGEDDHPKPPEQIPSPPVVEPPQVLEEGEDATDKLLAFIREQGGRVTQKDLRKKFHLSDAKISLLVADLESKNLIKKIKQGRGNIILLP